MKTIVPLVEGHGEVEAVGVLLRRMVERHGRFDVRIARPFRVKRNRVVKVHELERSLMQAVRSRSADAALVLLDADDDCPVTLASELTERVRVLPVSNVAIVFACREFEAWLLAGKQSLRGHCDIREEARCVEDAESVRDAKGRLTSNMTGARRYLEIDDQPSLAAVLDLELAERHARSFRKFAGELGRLLKSI